MTRAEINSDIRYYEGLINSYRRSVQNLSSQLSELRGLKSKLDALQSNFGNRQSSRKNKLAAFSAGILNVKTLAKYVSGMNSLLSGNEYKKAYSGLDTAKSKVSHKITSIQDEIDSYNSKIASCSRRISNLRSQLRNAEE